jgi:hypothetical protein
MTRDTDRIEEKVYKSLWHFLIAGVGFYELRNHKSTLSKVLSVGLIAFHIDGAISDITGCKPLSRRVLESVAGKTENDTSSDSGRKTPKDRVFKIKSIRIRD